MDTRAVGERVPGEGRGGSGGLIRPMLPTAGPVPTSPGWGFELKWDGVRAIGYATATGVRLYSRNDRDISRSYPELAALVVGDGLVLDGEIVAVDERGRPDFGRLQQRMHVIRPSAELIARVPVRWVVFDLLRGAGQSLLALPYAERRALLEQLDLNRAGVQVPAAFLDTPGAMVMNAAAEQGLEGVVAKRLTSAYEPGRRSRAWIKTAIRHTAEVIIAGWMPATGTTDVIGSLLLAAHTPAGQLTYVGDVGTGFTDAARRLLHEQLRPLHRDRPPFPDVLGGEAVFMRARGWPGRPTGRVPVHWVESVLVGEIEFRAFTREQNFRHPSWRGLRPDRDPGDVHLPSDN